MGLELRVHSEVSQKSNYLNECICLTSRKMVLIKLNTTCGAPTEMQTQTLVLTGREGGWGVLREQHGCRGASSAC